ncbi:PASTA domain-containing protein [Nocardiopsis sp. JB363]|uniref:PASTA domain-containing protein n=1 Tax=Nocardiopsis sp. JB363 TaxID=1434837 RepID=UPI000B353EEC|nr:PASTA domain-containing protein [Nocardiopsis sp. JB363]
METSTHDSSAQPPPVPPAPLAGRYRCGDGTRVDDRTLLFEARDLVANTPVLVLLDETATEHADAPFAQWERLRGIDHPVLQKTRDHGIDTGRAWVVCDVPAGEPLQGIVGGRFGERVSRREALDVIDTLLSVLEEFHEQGLAHGAVGLDTVFLADDGSVRLLPLVSTPDSTVTDPSEDVRAVGELLRVMIAGMGTGEADGAISEAGDEFALLVDKATAVDPDHRPRDAGRYRALVHRVRERLPATSGRHAASGARQGPALDDPTEPSEDAGDRTDDPARTLPTKTKGRRALLLAAAGVLLLVLVAGLLTWSLTSSEDGAQAEAVVVTMPDLVGISPEDATEHIDSLAVSPDVSYDQVHDDDVDAGLVSATTPESGASLTEDDPVTIVVAIGPESLSMPDVVDEAEADARRSLADLGFTDVTIVQEASDSVPSGTVLETDPEAEETVAYDAPVTLTVSEGVTLPDLVEHSEEEARAALDALGLAAEVVVTEQSDRPEGEVVSQSPTVGAIVEPASTVVLTVSPGPETEEDAAPDEQPQSDTSDRDDGRSEPGVDAQGGGAPEQSEESTEPAAPEPQTCTSAAWSEGTGYSEGSTVVHEGREYEAVWWPGNISPSETADWGPWREIGTC